MSFQSALDLFSTFSPILLPLAAWLISLIVRHIPANRLTKLQQIASSVVPAIEQQANGGWTNEQKYNAAAQAFNLLAARFGYRVNEAEVKLLVEGAVAAFKGVTSSTSAVPPSGALPSDFPTQTVESSAGAL